MTLAAPSGGLHDRWRPAAGAEIFGPEALFAPFEGPRPGYARERRPRAHGGRHGGVQHLEREEKEQDDRWPGEHDGREQRAG